MPETNESRVDTQTGSRHVGCRPYHFSSPNQEERIRRIFGLAEESSLPLVRHETLAAYFEFLMTNLAMPFEALYCQNGGELRQLIHYVHVLELVDPKHSHNHSLHGLLCKAKNHRDILELPLAECGVREDNPNCQLIDDYAFWFVNCR